MYDEFAGPLSVRDVPSPALSPDGVAVRVAATGVCRSDWHAWQGHDEGVRLPHVPGHELAGTVEAVGRDVRSWQVGDRVTAPFVCACGRCPRCLAGDHQVCDRQTQPGFTHWGSFAEFVTLHAADVNLVALPDDLSFAAAASLGCRFGTAFRAVVHQGRVRPGQWVAVHGCGGVGLSAVHVGVQAGARVVAVDVSAGALALARSLGAETTVDARDVDPADVAASIVQVTGGGAHTSLDALGSPDTCRASIGCLRPRGRHVQVGLLPRAQARPPVPMGRVVALELEIVGSHGMPAHAYPELLGLISTGRLRPAALITRELSLDEAGDALRDVGARPGIAMVTTFSS
jgi:alcohol dehydrogenase